MQKKIVFILFFMLVLAPVFTATATYLPTNMDQPIDPPTEPEPEDGATDLVVDPELSVLVTFSGSGKAVAKFYDASDDSYIGGDSVVNNSRAYEEWNNLKPLTTYYWYFIVTYEGYEIQSDTWEFTTGTENNNPPTVPSINGPTSGKPGQIIYYRFISTDPDDHDVYYEIDGGDGKFDTIGPYTSNVLKNKYHVWTEKGDFTIKARAKDVYGEYSDWGEYNIKIVKKDRIASNLLLLRFLKQLPIVYSIFWNLFTP